MIASLIRWLARKDILEAWGVGFALGKEFGQMGVSVERSIAYYEGSAAACKAMREAYEREESAIDADDEAMTRRKGTIH